MLQVSAVQVCVLAAGQPYPSFRPKCCRPALCRSRWAEDGERTAAKICFWRQHPAAFCYTQHWEICEYGVVVAVAAVVVMYRLKHLSQISWHPFKKKTAGMVV